MRLLSVDNKKITFLGKFVSVACHRSQWRTAKVLTCRNFALSINDSASFGCTRWEIASALAFHSFARTVQ